MKNTSLKSLVKSAERGEVVLPYLKAHLLKEAEEGVSHNEIVMADAKMTVDCFTYRLKAYNHGEKPKQALFHPSALSTCQRRLWYEHHQAPADATKGGADMLRTHMVFEIGTYAHVIIQNLCERAGILVAREIPIVDLKLKILGHADGHLRINKEDYLLEFKTSNARSFTMLNGPQEGHIKQAHGYMKSLGFKKACIIYFNKDSAELKEFVVPYSEDFYQRFVAKRIESHFKNLAVHIPPDREGASPTTMPCLYCQFTQVCFETRAGNEFAALLKKKFSARKLLRP